MITPGVLALIFASLLNLSREETIALKSCFLLKAEGREKHVVERETLKCVRLATAARLAELTP